MAAIFSSTARGVSPAAKAFNRCFSVTCRQYAKSPELNPTENVWQYLRDNWLSNRVFSSLADVVDHCCHAWNKLIDQPGTIMSIGLRDWAHA